MTRDQRRFLRAHDTLARTPGGLDALGREQAAVAIALLQQAEAEHGRGGPGDLDRPISGFSAD
jgi:hypothetical protein